MTTPIIQQTNAIQLLEELYAMRDMMAINKKAQIDQVIPEEVKQELEAINIEFAQKEDMLAERISELEADLKARAVASRETINGTFFDVRFTKGGYAASAKDVFNLANRWEKTNPEVAADIRSIVTVKASSASIRAKGGI
jgi:hypothetical protein